MQSEEINKLALSYYKAHGDAAEAEVTQKASAAEAAGQEGQAEEWRAVREAIRQLRGANQG